MSEKKIINAKTTLAESGGTDDDLSSQKHKEKIEKAGKIATVIDVLSKIPVPKIPVLMLDIVTENLSKRPALALEVVDELLNRELAKKAFNVADTSFLYTVLCSFLFSAFFSIGAMSPMTELVNMWTKDTVLAHEAIKTLLVTMGLSSPTLLGIASTVHFAAVERRINRVVKRLEQDAGKANEAELFAFDDGFSGDDVKELKNNEQQGLVL